MPLSYANPGSGPSAGGIGWFNFGNLNLKPGDTIPGLTGTFKDGSTVTFDLSSDPASTYTFTAYPSPNGGNFGYTGYTGIPGSVILLSDRTTGTGIIKLSNIVVKDINGNPVTNYTAVVADAEDTNTTEQWVFDTDAGVWNLLATLGSSPPTLTGVGTQTATITGNSHAFAADYVLTSQAPKNLTLTSTSLSGLEGIAIGFAVTRVILRKNIGARLDSNDQFVLDITGNPSNQVTTTGITNGVQNPPVGVFGLAGNTYTINESMEPLSVNPLSAYGQIVSATNASLGQTVPPIGPLPINVTTQLGDIIVYEILNTVPETFVKSVDKQYANVGDVLTYTVTVKNPNSFPVNNVLITDPIPAGTTFGSLLSVTPMPYSGTNPATGITIATLGANSSAVVSWTVVVNNTLPLLSPLTNVATVSIDNGTSGSTNAVTTIINHANLVSAGNFLKTGNPPTVNVGDTIAYTLTVKNTGNTAANNVVITDPAPAGTTYVPGSITSGVVFTGDPTSSIKLTAPIIPGQTVTINFNVKVGNTVPKPNPIPNQAAIAYAYTVDPANPNGVKVNGLSTITNTLVSTAKLSTQKTADKTVAYIGDTITYNIAVTNTGNVPANKVVVTDPIPNGTSYVPGSLTVSGSYSGSPTTAITLTDPIAPGATVAISFQVKVSQVPNPNPINNKAIVDYAYTVNPQNPDGVTATSTSNSVLTLVFKYNFSKQITDLIESIALEEAALAAIANAEGAKIQAMVAMNAVTPHDLLCLNKSVADMIDSITILNSILKQKLSTVNCQIDPPCM